MAAPRALPGRSTWSWITYPQLWLVGINAVHIVQLRHKVLGHVPGSVDAHCQGVQDLSMNPAEGGWEVSALMQHDFFFSADNKQYTGGFIFAEMKMKIEQAHMLEKSHGIDTYILTCPGFSYQSCFKGIFFFSLEAYNNPCASIYLYLNTM